MNSFPMTSISSPFSYPITLTGRCCYPPHGKAPRLQSKTAYFIKHQTINSLILMFMNVWKVYNNDTNNGRAKMNNA
jgi:hypothetical protein